jgi:putative addiction module killer protein
MWTVDVAKIEKWLHERTKEQKTAIARRLLLLQKLGPDLGMPNVKALGNGLYELREMSFGYRLYFYFDRENNKIIVVVAAGEKDTQERDIRKAKEAIK